MKILFDLDEFKKFLDSLIEVNYNSGCRSSYDYEKLIYYLDDEYHIKVKRILCWDDGYVVDKDDNYYDDMTIKGEIIDEI